MDKLKTGEMIRQTRMEKEKRNKIIVWSMGTIISVLLLLIGFRTFFEGYPLFSTIYYFYFMAIILIVISLKGIFDHDSGENLQEKNIQPKNLQRKADKRSIILSLATGIYTIAIVLITTSLVNHDIIPFNMNPGSVGPFINWQLVAMFVINLICFAIECISAGLSKRDLHVGIYIIVTNIFLTMVYSDLLHRLSSPQDFYSIFIVDTVVIIAEAIIIYGIVLLLKRVFKSEF